MPSVQSKYGPKCRYWMFTIPADAWSVPERLPDGVSYLCGQKEQGTSGTDYVHWQGVVYYTDKIRLAKAKTYFPNVAHLEPTRSEAARDYVQKDDTSIGGTRFELGSLPKRRNNHTDWLEVWNLAKAGQISPIPANIRVQNYRTIRQISTDYANPVGILRQVRVYFGTTGVGKSRRAWFEAGIDAYPKDPRSKWWCGYRAQQHVIIDEFRGAIDISHMLRWCDRYPISVETKGGATPLMASKIWITSNLHPRDWYVDLDVETKDALMRRLEIEEMTESWTEPEEDWEREAAELLKEVYE